MHNNRVGISGNIVDFIMFSSNTDTKFREPYHSNHMIPRLGIVWCLIIQDSTGVFLLPQYSIGVVGHPRDLQVS